MGRNGCPFGFLVLVVLVVLFILVKFIRAGAIAAVALKQEVGQTVQWNHFVGITLRNGGAWHAAGDAGVFALRFSHFTCGFKCVQTFGSVLAVSRHEKAHGSEAKVL